MRFELRNSSSGRRFPLLPLSLGAVLCVALGAAATFWLTRPKPPPAPSPMLVVQRIRDVARLEALEVTLYRKITFSPDPAASRSLWGELWEWARYTLRSPSGRAIVFARAHLSYDLGRLDARQLQQDGPRAELTLPPLDVVVELLPEETEIIGSNLNSHETAELLAHAKKALEQEVRSDPRLRSRAQSSADQTLRVLLHELGFRQVVIVAPAG